jgi:hypothetical protein
MTEQLTVEQLVSGLTSLLENGYIDLNSYNNPIDDAIEYLGELLVKDTKSCLSFCKKILSVPTTFDDDFIKGTALNFLLLSNEWFSGFNYLVGNSQKLSIPELEKALFYFYCAKNETDPYPVPEGLFNKLIERYQMVKDQPDAKFYHLDEIYNDFISAYSLGS